MNIILLLISFIIFTAATFPKYRAWQDVSGNVFVKHYPEDSRLPNETDEQLMDRWDAITDQPDTGFVTLTKTDIPTDRSDREKWRIQDGQVKVDVTAPSPKKDAENKKKSDRNQAKTKLQSGQNLTQQDIDSLFPN